MRPIEIESWALRVLSQLEKGSPIEDARVELKAKWPDAAKAARQIAGHANAARGDDLLWLIGVDEVTGVVGAAKEELANWLPSLMAEFESTTPEINSINVYWASAAAVVALNIRTDRAPYLVKVPDFGKTKGLAVQWEVPWRAGNSTRTAVRSELFQILIPRIEQPQFEVLNASASFDLKTNTCFVRQRIYIIPPRDSFYVFPKHRIVSLFDLGESCPPVTATVNFYRNEGSRVASLLRSAATRNTSPNVTVKTGNEAVEVTATERIVRAPGVIMSHGKWGVNGPVDTDQPLKVETWFESAHDRVTGRLACVMQRKTDVAAGLIEWAPGDINLRSQFSVH